MARATVIADVSLADSYRSNAEYLEAIGGDFAIVLRKCEMRNEVYQEAQSWLRHRGFPAI